MVFFNAFKTAVKRRFSKKASNSSPTSPPTTTTDPADSPVDLTRDLPSQPDANEQPPEPVEAETEAAPEQEILKPEIGVQGAYLTFDSASNGAMFLNWSATPVAGSFAFFEPQRPVPDFKFKDKGGRSELLRNLMSDKTKYFEGWCQFFKAAVEFEGKCLILPAADEAPLKVDVAFLIGNCVVRMPIGTVVSAQDVGAIGVVPRGSNGFIDNRLQRDAFLRNSRQGGAGLTMTG